MRDILSPEGLEKMALLDETPVSSYEEWQKASREYRVASIWYWSMLEIGGNLLRQGVDLIALSAGNQPHLTQSVWKQSKPIIYTIRERVGPSYFRNMEYFIDTVEKHWEEHPELAP